MRVEWNPVKQGMLGGDAAFPEYTGGLKRWSAEVVDRCAEQAIQVRRGGVLLPFLILIGS